MKVLCGWSTSLCLNVIPTSTNFSLAVTFAHTIKIGFFWPISRGRLWERERVWSLRDWVPRRRSIDAAIFRGLRENLGRGVILVCVSYLPVTGTNRLDKFDVQQHRRSPFQTRHKNDTGPFLHKGNVCETLCWAANFPNWVEERPLRGMLACLPIWEACAPCFARCCSCFRLNWAG